MGRVHSPTPAARVRFAVKALGCAVALLGLSLSPGVARGGAIEASRAPASVTVGKNTVTVDTDVRYVGYTVGDTIPITLDYSATCNIVFNGLELWKTRPFAPPKLAAGQLWGVNGAPGAGSAATSGSVTFNLRFTQLARAATGEQSGQARAELTLGVDKDCDLATGDSDGVDGSKTIRIWIRVSTGQ